MVSDEMLKAWGEVWLMRDVGRGFLRQEPERNRLTLNVLSLASFKTEALLLAEGAQRSRQCAERQVPVMGGSAGERIVKSEAGQGPLIGTGAVNEEKLDNALKRQKKVEGLLVMHGPSDARRAC
ncbi:hypothetical protein CCMA1212_010088 [Trichoderma ghanense]|uniref:Uncharacterized protein n=1 Tax=Trichoderma ghanense TaxID=65468 RepID=A0ABY2GSL4_9HYPO